MNFKNIANWCLQENTYCLEEIIDSKYLTIQILNNQIFILNAEYLNNGKMEERQNSICKLLNKITNKQKLPNIILNYCTHDRYNNTNGAVFTHARLKGIKTKNILAPCFTFYGYPENSSILNKIIKYEDTWQNLIDIQKDWSDKENNCIFVGSLTDANYRIINTNLNFNNDIKLLLKNQGADSKEFVSRNELKNYKYLLHLNGNAGAYASRFKYLLGAGGLAIYNCNSGSETNMWEEWWMNPDIFKPNEHYVLTQNAKETQDAINYFYNNDRLAEQIAKNGFNFFKNNLHPDNIDKFWYHLLTEYKKRCNFEILIPMGKLFNEE